MGDGGAHWGCKLEMDGAHWDGEWVINWAHTGVVSGGLRGTLEDGVRY